MQHLTTFCTETPGFNQQHEICSQNKVMNHSHAVGHSLVGGLEHEIYTFQSGRPTTNQ